MSLKWRVIWAVTFSVLDLGCLVGSGVAAALSWGEPAFVPWALVALWFRWSVMEDKEKLSNLLTEMEEETERLHGEIAERMGV